MVRSCQADDDLIDNRFLPRKSSFDLPDLDPKPANLHLVVDSSAVFDRSVRQPAAKISCPVQPFSWLKRMLNELLTG
ncbi:hypothetical protein D3C71_1399970 [compost metagenome]